MAYLTEEQLEMIQSNDRGDVTVQVDVSDEKEGSSPPIACEMIWAWVPKPEKTKKSG